LLLAGGFFTLAGGARRLLLDFVGWLLGGVALVRIACHWSALRVVVTLPTYLLGSCLLVSLVAVALEPERLLTVFV